MASLVFESSIFHVCKKISLNDVIFCELCKTWRHAKCLKITKRQLNTLSNTDDPFFCANCISLHIPYCQVTNTRLDLFNSNTFNLTLMDLPHCFECTKVIHNHYKSINCKIGKHCLHLRCAKVVNINHINRALWSCCSCLLFPFDTLNDNQFEVKLNVNNNSKSSHDLKIKLFKA